MSESALDLAEAGNRQHRLRLCPATQGRRWDAHLALDYWRINHQSSKNL